MTMIRLFLLIFLTLGLVVPVNAQPAAEAPQFPQAIAGFNSGKEIWLFRKPSLSNDKDQKIDIAALGNVDDLLITSAFPGNKIVTLQTADGFPDTYVYVRYFDIVAADELQLATIMGISVPPGVCLNSLNIRQSLEGAPNTGGQRGFGGC